MNSTNQSASFQTCDNSVNTDVSERNEMVIYV